MHGWILVETDAVMNIRHINSKYANDKMKVRSLSYTWLYVTSYWAYVKTRHCQDIESGELHKAKVCRHRPLK
jgi:hypothetical protein